MIKASFCYALCRHLAKSPNAAWHLPEEESEAGDSGERSCQPVHLNPNMEVCFPREPGAHCHFGCSGVAPLSLVVSVSGKSSPGSEGMPKQRWRWSEGLQPRMPHVFHLWGNSYGSLCNHRSLLCAATWLLSCDGVEAEMKPPVHSNTTKQNNLHIVEQENNNPLTNEGTYYASLWQIRTLFMPEQNVSDMIWLEKKRRKN